MIRNFFLIVLCFLSIINFAQTDFKTSSKNKDGLNTVYYTLYKSGKMEYRYGLYDEAKQSFILPMKYERIWFGNEPNLYFAQDTLKKWGLFSTKIKTFLIEPRYSDINIYSDGLAIVKDYIDNNYKYGVIDNTGKLIIPQEYQFIGSYKEGLMSFKKEKGYGFIDKNKRIVIPAIYRSATYFSNGLAAVSLLDSTYFGFIDKNNTWIIPPKYLSAYDFTGKYTKVHTTRNYKLNVDQVGIIDEKGKEIIPLKYKYISIEDDFFIVKDVLVTTYSTKDIVGIMDLNGKVIIPIEYDNISKKYGTDYFETQKDKKYGLLDKNMNFKIQPIYDYIYSFNEAGISYLKKDGKFTLIDKNLKVIVPEKEALNIILGKNNVAAYINKDKVELYNFSGKLLKTIKGDNITTFGTDLFSNDDSIKVKQSNANYLYSLSTKTRKLLDYEKVSDFNKDGIFIAQKSTYNFLDFNGTQLNTKSYYGVVNFSDDICAVQETSTQYPYLANKTFTKISGIDNIFEGPFSEGLAKAKASYGSTIYYYDKKGNKIITTPGTSSSDFTNGRAYIKTISNKFYFINKSGQKINNDEYDEVGVFSENIAPVRKGNTTSYIDTTGKLAFSNTFDIGTSFFKGVAMVKKGTEYYLINKKGERLNRDIYNGAKNPENGSFPVQKGIYYGLINETGKVIIDFKYQDITPLSEGICWAKKNDKYGLVNSNGTEITAFEYTNGLKCTNGYIIASKGEKYGLLDKLGKVIIPFEYDNMGTVYNNSILLMINETTKRYAIK